MLWADLNWKLHEFMEIITILYDPVISIWNDDNGMMELAARWVTCLLVFDCKHHRVTASME